MPQSPKLSPSLNPYTLRLLDEDAMDTYCKPYADCSYNEQGMLRDDLAAGRT